MNDKPMDRKQRSEIGGCMPFISCLFRALMAMTLIAVAIGAMSAHAAGNVLKEMSFSSLPGGAVRIVLIAENCHWIRQNYLPRIIPRALLWIFLI